MNSPLSISFITLCLLLLLHAPPTSAKRDPNKRSQAWCEFPREKARPVFGRIVVDRKAVQASKDCCAAVRHFAYFNEVAKECWGQGGVADRSIRWTEYKRCCQSREDAGLARSNEIYQDEREDRAEASAAAAASASAAASTSPTSIR